MGKELFSKHDAARRTFETVSESVGFSLPELCFESDEETLRQTQNAQIALYATGLASWFALNEEAPSITPCTFAGHSVGEYAALVASGIVSIEDGARMVAKRGELMASAGKERAGGMAAILGLDRVALENVCDLASSKDEVAVIANDNCPGQLVISGDAAAVQRASTMATEAGAKRAIPLNVSGAFHSPLMADAAKDFGAFLREFEFRAPQKAPVVSNVLAAPASGDADWPELLARQLLSPVRWTESVQWMVESRVRYFVECGPGEVLCGLVRRIHPEATVLNVGDLASLEKTVSTFQEAMG